MLASRRLAKSLESQIQIGSERMPPLVRLVDTLWEVMISTQDLKSSHQSSISSIADHAVVRKGVPGTSSIRNSIRHRSIRAMIGSWLPSGAFSQPVTTRENVLALAADSELIFIAVEGLALTSSRACPASGISSPSRLRSGGPARHRHGRHR